MGVDVMTKLVEISKFPWLLSNVFEGSTPLAKALPKKIISLNSLKVELFFIF